MERSSTISSGRSCCELSRLLPFHSRLPRTRQGPLRVGSVRRAPCESKDCHRRTDLQEWELGGLMSCLLWPPCLLRSELQLRPPSFRLASLPLSSVSLFSMRISRYRSSASSMLNFRFFGLCRISRLDDLSHLSSQLLVCSFHIRFEIAVLGMAVCLS